MSWQLGSACVLGVVLAIGFGWYERSRPPAKVIALVAALAALATVGRIAFAPFPNVKPTTDIALFAGYALGSAPGFAVGAVAALASNFFFGQGPWTPWQMFAWGLVGIGGGLLARVCGRELGRLPLALACALAGAGFGVIMDGFQWTLGARQDLAHYLAISAGSLSFNIAHVIGNVVFCLALGPAFVRALQRYRRRFDVRWVPAAQGLAVSLVALTLVGVLAQPAPASASTASRAVAYLESAQNGDGGFGPAPGSSSTQLETGWVALGLAGAGVNPAGVHHGGSSPIDYLAANAGQLSGVGDIERTILVLVADGQSPRSFAGHDFVAELAAHQSAKGSFGGSDDLTAFGALALTAAGAPGAGHAAGWLAAHQGSDGGYGPAPGGPSYVDDTAATLEALAATGTTSGQTVERAVRYLRSAQDGDGGLPMSPGDGSNAQSTAWAAQGLDAVGVGAGALSRHGRTPLSYLGSLQAADGSIHYSSSSDQTPVWVTAEALDAIEGRPFPLSAAGHPAGGGALGHRGHRAAGRHRRRGRRGRVHTQTTGLPATAAATPLRTASKPVTGRRSGLATWMLIAIILLALACIYAAWRAFSRWWFGVPAPPAVAGPEEAANQADGELEAPPVPAPPPRAPPPPAGPRVVAQKTDEAVSNGKGRKARRHAHIPAHMR